MDEGHKSELAVKLLADKSFSVLEGHVSEQTLEALKTMGMKTMTDVQAQCIPHALDGKDLLGAAKTGSGKTLAFLIPVVENIHKCEFRNKHGTGAIIISPTRELALQTYSVLKQLLEHHSYTFGLVIGGTSKKKEAQSLEKGINILVVTPGRLLDHLQNTKHFLYKNLEMLIIDEADRILQDGFEDQIKSIIEILPKSRQTLLFSATQTKNTEDLGRLSFKTEPVYVGVDDNKDNATVEGLQQGFFLCPPEKRFLMLFTFLKKNKGKKIMVFMSARLTVEYFHDLLNLIDIPVMAIHGGHKQTKRTTIFYQFCQETEGVLLCTDVAARGLDIPAVDWIVQYEPPDDPQEYIHRVGRTARGEGTTGHALLFLMAEEIGFLKYLEEAKVPMNEYKVSWKKVAKVQMELERLISQDTRLHQSAVDGFKAYIRAYASHSLKDIFNINLLDRQKVALSFGLTVPPNVTLGGEGRGQKRSRDLGGAFSFEGGSQKKRKLDKMKIFKKNSNVKQGGDKRMFTR